MALEKVGTFVLTDESLDADSERVVIDGVDISRFEGNPVMLYNHIRSASSWFGENPDTRAILPIGRWENIRKQRKRIVADAYIDFDDEFAAKVGNKVRNGVLNAVSIGFRPMAWSDDPEDMVKGQTGLTITKAELWEASLVDIPSNPNALAISVSKSVMQPEAETKQANPNGIFIKTFHKLKDTEMANDKNWFEKAKTFLAKFGKTVETEEDALKAFDETELPEQPAAPAIDTEAVKALVSEAVTEQVKNAVESVKADYEAKFIALTSQVVELAQGLQETEQVQEVKEDESAKAIKALELQIANIKAGRRAEKSGIDAPPANAANTADNADDVAEGYAMIAGVLTKVAKASDVLDMYRSAKRNNN